MENYYSQISGWLNASGNSLVDMLPADSGICRIVSVEPEKYWTGYVSTGEGSFKHSGDAGNWYATSFGVSFAEVKPTVAPIYEHSRLREATPVWNMNKLPEPFLTAIYDDRNLVTGQFCKSQFIIECLQALDLWNNASGIYFPSRRASGGVVILNPQAINLEILYTGQSPPTGLI